MLPPGTNRSGAIFFFGAFLSALGIGKLAGTSAEGPLTIIGGLLVIGLDTVFRLWRTKFRLLRQEPEGIFLFMPIWIFGVFWVVLGIFYTIIKQT